MTNRRSLGVFALAVLVVAAGTLSGTLAHLVLTRAERASAEIRGRDRLAELEHELEAAREEAEAAAGALSAPYSSAADESARRRAWLEARDRWLDADVRLRYFGSSPSARP